MTSLPADDLPPRPVTPAADDHDGDAVSAFDAGVERELRLSVVLYGGVSLAIYMNGVCQELLNLVRATSGRANARTTRGLSELYRQYQRAASITPTEIKTGYADPFGVDDLDARGICRRVVIDVLSGSSAGGLNALFLSRALLTDGDIDTMATLLVKHADFVALLNDAETTTTPYSLLSGDNFYDLLLGALLDQDTGRGRSLVDALDCYLTMTDLRGIPADEAALAEGQVVRELQHRAVAHLVYGTPTSYGAARNDFIGSASPNGSIVEPFLAFVGRSTAAHPAAFEPVQFDGLGGLIDSVLEERGRGTFDVRDHRWASLVTPTYAPEQLASRWFSDGGDLDNKPFTHAIDPVDQRRSTIPIDRRIVYIEPDPHPPSEGWADTGRPSLVAYTAGAFTLPRREGIVDDLARIERRNQQASGLQASLRDAIKSPAVRGTRTRPPTERWVEPDEDPPNERRLYEIDRARDVIERLTTWIEDTWLSHVSVGVRDNDLTARIRAHVEKALGATGDELQKTIVRRQILVDHDIGYRLRRLNFLDRVLDEHQRDEPSGMTVRLQVDATAESVRAAASLRAELNESFLQTLAIERRLSLRDRYQTASLASAVDESAIQARCVTAAGRLANGRDDLGDFTRDIVGLRNQLSADHLRSVSARVWATINERSIAQELALPQLYLDFDSFDVHLLPRYAVTNGEVSPIKVSRFSPSDVTEMTARAPDAARLGGAAIGHFGAFFDERWRRNDILWGRLDAAELIIKMLMPVQPGEPAAASELRRALIRDAQREIITTEGDAVAAMAELTSPTELRNDLASATQHELLSGGYSLDLTLDDGGRRSDTRAQLLGRVPRLIGRVLGAAAGTRAATAPRSPGVPVPVSPAAPDPPASERAAARAERVGRLTNALMQLALPRSIAPKVVRFGVLPVLFVFAFLLFVFSGYDGWDDWQWAPRVGLAILVVALAAAHRLRGRGASRHVCVVLGASVAAAGFLLPLAGGSIDDPARAWCYATIAVLAGGLYGALVFGFLLPSGRVRTCIVWASGLVALASVIGALVTDWRTTTVVTASLVSLLLTAGLFVLFAVVQKMVAGQGHERPRRQG